MVNCRECEREVNQATEICPHCGADLTLPPPGAEGAPAKPAIGRILLRWSIVLGVLLAAVWSFLWFVVPERQGNPAARAEQSAAQALRNLRGSLSAYSSAEAGAYPRQLDALGENARAAAQLAQSANYQLQYAPGAVEADGTIRTYSLQARAGNFGFLNFFADDTGAIHATRENRAATPQDPLY